MARYSSASSGLGSSYPNWFAPSGSHPVIVARMLLAIFAAYLMVIAEIKKEQQIAPGK